MQYDHTQHGWIIVILLGTVIAYLWVIYLTTPFPLSIFLLGAGFFALLTLLFYRLRVRVNASGIWISYGIGLINIRVQPDEIHACEIVNTPWYYGWGIRYTPKGMLYNLQGSRAVRIDYKKEGSRKSLMIGTDEPEELQRALARWYGLSL